MNPLTPQEASARTKKGWDTRKKRNAAIGGGAAAAIAAPKLNNARRLYRHQYEWQRPNGQTVKLRGFSPREVQAMQPGLRDIDRHLKHSAAPALESIERRGVGMINSIMSPGAHAVYENSTDTTPQKAASMLSDPTHPNYNLRAKQIGEAVDTSERERNRMKRGVRIAKPLHQSKQGKIFVSPRSARRSKQKPESLAALATHEIGHAVDMGHIDPENPKSRTMSFKNFGKSGTQSISTRYGDNNEVFSKKDHKLEDPKGYQATQKIEDFAETFRGDLDRRSGAGRQMHDPFSGGHHFDPNISPERQKFMSRHVFEDVPNPEVGRVVAKKGMHVHTNKFLGGAAAVAAAGVGAYEYNKFRKQR